MRCLCCALVLLTRPTLVGGEQQNQVSRQVRRHSRSDSDAHVAAFPAGEADLSVGPTLQFKQGEFEEAKSGHARCKQDLHGIGIWPRSGNVTDIKGFSKPRVFFRIKRSVLFGKLSREDIDPKHREDLSLIHI